MLRRVHPVLLTIALSILPACGHPDLQSSDSSHVSTDHSTPPLICEEGVESGVTCTIDELATQSRTSCEANQFLVDGSCLPLKNECEAGKFFYNDSCQSLESLKIKVTLNGTVTLDEIDVIKAKFNKAILLLSSLNYSFSLPKSIIVFAATFTGGPAVAQYYSDGSWVASVDKNAQQSDIESFLLNQGIRARNSASVPLRAYGNVTVQEVLTVENRFKSTWNTLDKKGYLSSFPKNINIYAKEFNGSPLAAQNFSDGTWTANALIKVELARIEALVLSKGIKHKDGSGFPLTGSGQVGIKEILAKEKIFQDIYAELTQHEYSFKVPKAITVFEGDFAGGPVGFQQYSDGTWVAYVKKEVKQLDVEPMLTKRGFQSLKDHKIPVSASGDLTLKEMFAMNVLFEDSFKNMAAAQFTHSVPRAIVVTAVDMTAGPTSQQTYSDGSWLAYAQKAVSPEQIEALVSSKGIHSIDGMKLQFVSNGPVSIKEMLILETDLEAGFEDLAAHGYEYRLPRMVYAFGTTFTGGPLFAQKYSDGSWQASIQKGLSADDVKNFVVKQVLGS